MASGQNRDVHRSCLLNGRIQAFNHLRNQDGKRLQGRKRRQQSVALIALVFDVAKTWHFLMQAGNPFH